MPSNCGHSEPYMIDNGILDVYTCTRFKGNCYVLPNGGRQFIKMCEMHA